MLGPIYTKRRHQRCDKSAMMTEILFFKYELYVILICLRVYSHLRFIRREVLRELVTK